ncbi:phage tail assembly chaperone [Caballeronia sp. SEWSISQ10-4 2]|uniref:tail fiber assembly protein n=1 Tax=Caballeronia sp. SEWSISQ10-4 2 TaxID=2937438 RepID=UPI00264D88B9|nr:tail fiber assembly protein [Caballeronia sp. SEWSISQ10-4 2]MDN7179109.1 phage tail assembly chaperone [Caballeronia sp. SEWSISQ10-4 2]
MLAIETRWPHLVHGEDYVVAHQLDPQTGKHGADAFILRWQAEGIPKPALAPLLDEARSLLPVYMANNVRQQRDTLLSGSDWTMGHDSPEDKRPAWAEYRQALRDVPEQPGFPADVDWPEKPA